MKIWKTPAYFSQLQDNQTWQKYGLMSIFQYSGSWEAREHGSSKEQMSVE